MKHLPLLLLLGTLGFAADNAPRPNSRPGQGPEGPRPDGRSNPRLPVPLSPDEQKRLHEAMDKAQQDPAVKAAHEQAAQAQKAAAEAQQKARELTEEAARRADPSVAPILEKVRKAMDQRKPNQPEQPKPPERQPNGQPGRGRTEGNQAQPNERGGNMPGLSPDEQRRVREAMAKANENPAVREAREAAAAAQRKAIEISEDVARQADPSIAPLFEKMRKAGEPRRPQGENPRGRKQPE